MKEKKTTIPPAGAVKPTTANKKPLLMMALPIIVAVLLLFVPVPEGLPPYAWHYFAIFVGVIVGLIFEPLPGAVIGITGVVVIALCSQWLLFSPDQMAAPGFKMAGASFKWAVSGFGNSTVWLIFGAFMFAAGYDKTQFGRRLALILVKYLGRRSLTLGYAITFADLLLAPFTPSNTARSGGTIYPIIANLPPLYGSKPNDPSARKIGSYLMWVAITAACITDALIVNGKTIAVYAEKEAQHIPWQAAGAEVIVECTGFYTSAEKSQAHLQAGARKVLISAPAGEMKTIVYNVNDDTLTPDDTIISVASCTTNCLAPMAKVLQDAFGITVGTMTTIHAYTGTQSLVDGPRGKDLRASRAAAENVIPHTTGAAKAIGLVIPALSGKLKGHAQRVPTKTGSVTELVSVLEKKVTADEVNQAMRQAAEGNESFGYTEEEIVSSDIIGSHFGSIYDATQLEIVEAGGVQLVKTVAWYDNEYGFVTQLIRVLEKFAR